MNVFLRGAGAILAVATLAGCTSILDPSNSVQSTYSSPLSSERAYRGLLNVMKECYPAGVLIESNFFPESKEGEITIGPKNDLARFEWASWVISPASSGSKVEMKRHSRFARFEPVMPDWLQGRTPICPYGTRFEPMPSGSELNQHNMPVR